MTTQWLQKFSLVAALAIIAASVGCNRAVNTMVGGGEQMIIIGNPGLQSKIELVQHARRDEGGVMGVSVVLQSRVKKPLSFEYKFVWLDDDGFEVADTTAMWKPEIIQGFEHRKRIQGAAPGPRAKTFKLMVREPQPVK